MYTTIEQIEDYLNIDIASSFEDSVEEWIKQATDYIDNKTQTNFEASSGSRFYDGEGSSLLYIDDFTEIEKVKVDGEEVDVIVGKSTPIYKIKREDKVFPKGFDNVEVIGKVGYSEEPPKDIEMACTIIASGLIEKDGAKASESLEELSITYKDEKGLSDFRNALDIINSYRKNV